MEYDTNTPLASGFSNYVRPVPYAVHVAAVICACRLRRLSLIVTRREGPHSSTQARSGRP